MCQSGGGGEGLGSLDDGLAAVVAMYIGGNGGTCGSSGGINFCWLITEDLPFIPPPLLHVVAALTSGGDEERIAAGTTMAALMVKMLVSPDPSTAMTNFGFWTMMGMRIVHICGLLSCRRYFSMAKNTVAGCAFHLFFWQRWCRCRRWNNRSSATL